MKFCTFFLGLFISPFAFGENDKSKYSVFNPTPRSEMREFATDRPDKTESPYTVDAGCFQFETDVGIYSYDRSDSSGTDTRTQTYSLVATNFKIGVTHRTDLQWIITPYQVSDTDVGGTRTRLTGFGDMTVRFKINVYGNDSGDIALGLMPFVKIPTSTGGLSNGFVEGGLLFPIAIGLPNDWGMGAMIQVNRNKNGSDSRFHTKFISSLTFGRPILGELAGMQSFIAKQATSPGHLGSLRETLG